MQILHHFFDPIGDRLLQLLWHLIHLVVTIWYLARGIYSALESYLISTRVLKKYQSLETHKLKYVAVVVESEDAHHTAKIVELVKWLAAIGVRCVCLYDAQGILKRSKNFILANLNDARLFEEAFENDLLLDKKYITLEFVSLSDGKEAVAKAANALFMKYSKSCASGKNQEDQIFTEASMAEALKLVGCRGPEPDLLLVYGPARCHLGFPAWRIRYTEIVHMGPLKSMRYGSLIKAVYKFTMVRQNYGK